MNAGGTDQRLAQTPEAERLGIVHLLFWMTGTGIALARLLAAIPLVDLVVTLFQ